jgi:hypothetical protein
MKDWSLYLRAAMAIVALAAGPVFAGRPLVADDAMILAPRQCQVEAWTERHPDDPQTWIAPHCNFGGDWELIAGAGSMHVNDPGRASAASLLAAKTVFRPLTANNWGVGMVVGEQFAARSGPALGINFPLSVSLLADALRLHANAGWIRQPGVRSGPTWALAAEWTATRSLGFTLEAFGSGRAYTQAGVRYALRGGGLTLDAAVGDHLTLRGKQRYFALGLTFSGINLH